MVPRADGTLYESLLIKDRDQQTHGWFSSLPFIQSRADQGTFRSGVTLVLAHNCRFNIGDPNPIHHAGRVPTAHTRDEVVTNRQGHHESLRVR